MIRRAVLLLLATLLLSVGAGAGAGAGAAQAAGYRYWSFWDRDGDRWVYATQGPSLARPSDGDVQGFRFAVSEDSSEAARPRGAADFKTVCAKTPAQDGKKRVALVIDPGAKADAPQGETPPPARTVCARVSPDATTAEALATVAKPLRYDTNALLCAIAGYPKTGCGEQVANSRQSTPAAKKNTSDDDGPSLGLLAGIGVVAVLGAAAMWQVRRRDQA
ncbi:SCO2322 family protein [Streptomyces sp. CA-179760]|uniref:SCO2322 family protein n=1 Tax=Streptomyces sp. CA-179760 TaxID=3240054 RepID=UPI003D94F061